MVSRQAISLHDVNIKLGEHTFTSVSASSTPNGSPTAPSSSTANACSCAARSATWTTRHYAAAQPEDLIREEFTLMKDMGVNFVRLAHYQQTKLVLDLCDELGILVWEESTWCREGIGDAQWQAANQSGLHQSHQPALQPPQHPHLGARQ